MRARAPLLDAGELVKAAARMLLAATPIGRSPVDRGPDRVDRLVDRRAQIAPVVAYRLGHTARQLRAQAAGVSVGHVDQALLGIADHESASKRARRHCPPESDDHVEGCSTSLSLNEKRDGARRPVSGRTSLVRAPNTSSAACWTCSSSRSMRWA